MFDISRKDHYCRKEKSNTKIKKAVLLITATGKGLDGYKKGQLLKNVELSGQVENTGVEPVTSCMPCKRSSQLS